MNKFILIVALLSSQFASVVPANCVCAGTCGTHETARKPSSCCDSKPKGCCGTDDCQCGSRCKSGTSGCHCDEKRSNDPVPAPLPENTYQQDHDSAEVSLDDVTRQYTAPNRAKCLSSNDLFSSCSGESAQAVLCIWQT